MAKKKNMFLDFYNRTIKNGRMQYQGLCGNFDGCNCDDGITTLMYFRPSPTDIEELEANDLDIDYWGSGLKIDADYFELRYNFSPLRQTIVLFAALLDEELK